MLTSDKFILFKKEVFLDTTRSFKGKTMNYQSNFVWLVHKLLVALKATNVETGDASLMEWEKFCYCLGVRVEYCGELRVVAVKISPGVVLRAEGGNERKVYYPVLDVSIAGVRFLWDNKAGTFTVHHERLSSSAPLTFQVLEVCEDALPELSSQFLKFREEFKQHLEEEEAASALMQSRLRTHLA